MATIRPAVIRKMRVPIAKPAPFTVAAFAPGPVMVRLHVISGSALVSWMLLGVAALKTAPSKVIVFVPPAVLAAVIASRNEVTASCAFVESSAVLTMKLAAEADICSAQKTREKNAAARQSTGG